MSVWTTTDETVTPPETARLAGALDVPVQSVCGDRRLRHADLPRDPVVLGLVLRAVDGPPPQPVGPGECAGLRARGSA